MRTPSKRKCYPQRVLSKIDATSLHEKNQQKCIDCLKARLNKKELECKKCGCNKYYVLSYQSSSFGIYCPFHNV